MVTLYLYGWFKRIESSYQICKVTFLFNQKERRKNEGSCFWNLAESRGNVEGMTNKDQGIKASLGSGNEKVEELKIFKLITLYVFGWK